MPKAGKRKEKLLSRLQKLKRSARGMAWEALHRAESQIARNEGRIRAKGIGRPKGSKTKKTKKAASE